MQQKLIKRSFDFVSMLDNKSNICSWKPMKAVTCEIAVMSVPTNDAGEPCMSHIYTDY